MGKNIALICVKHIFIQMNFKVLSSSLFCLGIAASVFAAERISGEIVEDLYFSDAVKISGIEYPDDLGDDKGTSSVMIEGEGSVTIGARSGGGFPRIVLWGGTKIESEREWLEDITHKEWWTGEMSVPTKGRLVSDSELEFDVPGNHSSSDLVVLDTFAFGRNDSTVAETFKFSPAATVVLPVNVPDFTKIWVAYREGPDMNDIEEDSFCVVQGKLCIVDVSSANEISLVREKYERCPIEEIDNGVVGGAPYCQYTCNKGYTYNEDMTGCVLMGDEGAMDIIVGAADMDEMSDGVTSGETSLLAGPARQGYLRYTGTSLQRTKIDTTDLTGDELQRALRHNATVDSRKAEMDDETVTVSNDEDVALSLWKWVHRADANVLPEGDAVEEEIVVDADVAMEDAPMHGSAPLLPSTGPAGIFVGISALGFGLMTYARRRRH